MTARLHLPMLAPTRPVVTGGAGLVDGYGRVHRHLRVSVTDRCNLRCTYCMPESVVFRPQSELLSFEEIAEVVRVAVGLGVTQVRLTGGEPLVRRGLPELVRQLAAIDGLADLSLTTNGVLLEEFAEPLKRAGLHRLNVSLDTLSPDHFKQLARRGGLERVLAGLSAAKRAGFAGVKLNTVALRSYLEGGLIPLAEFARAEGFELRFIEVMPIGADDAAGDEFVGGAELIERLGAISPLEPVTATGSAPAKRYRYADGLGTVGVIASVSAPFCATCDRLRLTADGQFRNCLFGHDEFDRARRPARGCRGPGRSDCRGADRVRGGQGAGARDRGGDLPEAGADDARDRGLASAGPPALGREGVPG